MSPRSAARILVVDDQVEMVRLLADQLTDSGYTVELAGGGGEALIALRSRPFDLVLTDLRMKDVDGLDVVDAVRAETPFVPVIVMTAFGGIDSAVEAIKRGAFHYLTKPFQLEEVRIFVARALAERRILDENAALQRVAEERTSFGEFVGHSAVMRALYDIVERVAPTQAPVLIRGESGTGKELVARALHFRGVRARSPFVPINCTSLPEALLESELFGHLRGAYTGAAVARRGLFVEADRGTLFLDEIGDMAPGLQAKLLRVLEDGEIRPVGSDVPRKVDVRIVAATNQNLEQRIRDGLFRGDLFYRLNVISIPVPPLRERAEDIGALIEHFLAKARLRNPTTAARGFSPQLVAALGRNPWPGNVRELENAVERLVILSPTEVVDVEDFARCTPNAINEPTPFELAQERMPTLRQLEADYMAWVVGKCGGNKTRAADILGIDVSTIHRRERGGP